MIYRWSDEGRKPARFNNFALQDYLRILSDAQVSSQAEKKGLRKRDKERGDAAIGEKEAREKG
ncbi:MAG: hypothetical protein N2C12_18090 [Planctomycetales bacterium]